MISKCKKVYAKIYKLLNFLLLLGGSTLEYPTIKEKAMRTDRSIDDLLLLAKKRAQPYINLTNRKYNVEDLFSLQNLESFAKLGLKSIYYRTGELKLDGSFAHTLKKLTMLGIREILVFCDKETSNLTQEQFNTFISNYGARINLQIAPTSEESYTNISLDEIGAKDILGFLKIDDYKLLYRNGETVELLNSAASDALIRNNHDAYLLEIANNRKFGLSEPAYITKSMSDNFEVRTVKLLKELKNTPLEARVQLEISQEIKVEEIGQEVEQEKELDIDQDQLKTKMDQTQASEYFTRKYKGIFDEANLLKPISMDLNAHSTYFVSQIFSSHETIKYITEDALNKIIPHISSFEKGINLANLPIGLAFRDGIIFASEERLSSMPVNEATIRLDYLKSEISDPVNFSWLFYATKNSISLNDVYFQADFERIYGEDEHPLMSANSGDNMLDIPYNYLFSRLTEESLKPETNATKFLIQYEDFFPEIKFYPLSEQNQNRLADIWQQLKIRGINEKVQRIIYGFAINDGGFLLSEKAAIFFDKLFNEVLPIGPDTSKLDFFNEILKKSIRVDSFSIDNIAVRYSLEDVFESLEFSYNNFQKLLILQDISTPQDKDRAVSTYVKILKMHLEDALNFKVIVDRLAAILENSAKSGGNLQEQLDHLMSGQEAQTFVASPLYISKALDSGVNIIHSASQQIIQDINTKDLVNPAKDLFPAYLASVYDSTIYIPYIFLNIIYYLSKIPPHQRTSIDSYTSFFKKEINNFNSNPNDSAIACLIQEEFQTAEYYIAPLLKYPATIHHIGNDFILKEVDMFWIYQGSSIALSEGQREEWLNELRTTNQHYVLFNAETESSLVLEYGIGGKSIELVVPNMISSAMISWLQELSDKSQSAFGKAKMPFALIDRDIQDDLAPENPKLEEFIEENHLNHDVYKALADGKTFLTFDGENVRLFVKGEEVLEFPESVISQLADWDENGRESQHIWLPPMEVELSEGIIKIDDTTKTMLIKEAAGDADKLRELLGQTPKLEQNVPFCSPVTIINDGINFAHNYTLLQSIENLRLLALNIFTSSGRYYDKQYPNQEFASYLSLFNTMFEVVKVKEPVQVTTEVLEVIEDFNYKKVDIKRKFKAVNVPMEVKHKMKQHKEMIGKFLAIHTDNPEFKFGAIVALGVISIYHPGKLLEAVKNAKELLQYHADFYQLLRILIADDSTQDIKANALNIANNMAFLNSAVEGSDQKVYQVLTKNGTDSSSLIFFAACLGNKTDVNIEDVKALQSRLQALPQVLQDKILKAFADSVLPFSKGQIYQNSNFPKLTLEMLDDPASLENFGENITTISYEEATKYNDVSKAVLKNVIPDLSAIETKFNLTFNSSLKKKTYTQLKSDIDNDENFIIKNKQANGEVSTSELEFAFASEMFATLASHTPGWESIHNKTMELIFDTNQRLKKQFLALELSKQNIESLLQECTTQSEKEHVLDALLAGEKIPQDALNGLLTYLKGLDLGVLNLTLKEFLSITPKNLYMENLSLLKITMNSLLKSQLKIAPEQLLKQVSHLAAMPNSEKFAEKILSYCQKQNDFTLLDFVTNLNSKARNLNGVIKWLTESSPESIKKLYDNNNLDLKLLLSLKNIDKLKLTSEIAIELDKSLSSEQYTTLIKAMKSHTMDDARLVHSYLLVPASKYFSQQEKIDLVLNNLENPSAAQKLFAEYNLERFNYDSERVKAKIQEMVIKLAKSYDKYSELYDSYVKAITQAQTYKDMNYNQLHDKAIELKHNYILSKASSHESLLEQELEFMALAAEVMYRMTLKFPRDTQMLGFQNSALHNEHLIAEIATGQGKSIIAALHASYLWFIGQTVDVVTSSRNLAANDLKTFSPFYDALGIVHSDNIIKPKSELTEYKKGGVNYGIASDIALFRSDREFYSYKNDLTLNTAVSIICDEIDATLTSDVNYKLAIPLLATSEIETRVLFNYILDFAELDVFKNTEISRQDDVENLQMYLGYQFSRYDTSLHFPLTLVQQDQLLKRKDDLQAQQLYHLNNALLKCSKEKEKLYEKLLDSVVLANRLERGVDYVVLEHNEQKLKAIPIIKDQPNSDTMYGDGVHAFVHLLLERQNPQLVGKFVVQAPTATIFNVSPKNFFDYYHLTGGRIIGLTGTAGSEVELKEFAEVNKITAFSFPKYEADKKEIAEHLVANATEQEQEVLRLINEQADQPIIIFCESTKHAEAIYTMIAAIRPDKTKIFAASQYDSGSLQAVLANAGHPGMITVTTPMLGRGTDFFTEYSEGYLGINLCTDITPSSLLQIYGRVARNGHSGKMISFFNQEKCGESYEQHMLDIANQEKHTRMLSQPLTDILKYFSNANHDQQLNAVLTTEFITKAWNKLLAANENASRADLVEIVKAKYPDTSKHLDSYLAAIDDVNRSEPTQFSAAYSIQAKATYTWDAPISVNITQLTPKDAMTMDHLVYSYPVPTSQTSNYAMFYQMLNQFQYGKMLSHTFTFSGGYAARATYTTYRKQKDNEDTPEPGELLFFNALTGDISSIFMLGDHGDKELRVQNSRKDYGIPKYLWDKIKNDLTCSDMDLTAYEQDVLSKYYESPKIVFGAEEAYGEFMLHKFKYAFDSYIKKYASSAELAKIADLVHNFMPIGELDLSTLEYGKFQAIQFTTKFTSEAGHLESILTDGKLLLWINRGGGAFHGAGLGDGTGIKIFKITKGFEEVKSVLNGLKAAKSQTETRKDIYSLLREDGDENVPEFVLVPMKPQKVGNCAWTQTKGMLFAFGIVGHMLNGDKLPDEHSQEWQNIIKDARDIYKDFTAFDRIILAEEVLYILDSTFKPHFLDDQRVSKIDELRMFIEAPVAYDMLIKMLNKLEMTRDNYTNTVYEDAYNNIVEQLDLEIAFASKYGLVLQHEMGSVPAKKFLAAYKKAELGTNVDLLKIYEASESTDLKYSEQVTNLFEHLANLIVLNQIDLDQLDSITKVIRTSDQECSAETEYDEYCIIQKFSDKLQLLSGSNLYTVEA